MPFKVGDEVEFVPLPEDHAEQEAEIKRREDAYPGWCHQMTTQVQNNRETWVVTKTSDEGGNRIYAITNTKNGASRHHWAENWIRPITRTPLTCASFLKILARN